MPETWLICEISKNCGRESNIQKTYKKHTKYSGKKGREKTYTKPAKILQKYSGKKRA